MNFLVIKFSSERNLRGSIRIFEGENAAEKEWKINFVRGDGTTPEFLTLRARAGRGPGVMSGSDIVLIRANVRWPSSSSSSSSSSRALSTLATVRVELSGGTFVEGFGRLVDISGHGSYENRRGNLYLARLRDCRRLFHIVLLISSLASLPVREMSMLRHWHHTIGVVALWSSCDLFKFVL